MTQGNGVRRFLARLGSDPFSTRKVVEEGSGTGRPTLLIISHSDIAKDARLRKQISLLTKHYHVTVCGYGEPFDTDAELLLRRPADTKRTDQVRALLLHTNLFRLAQHFEADNVAARRLLRGRSFDAAIANDIEPVGLCMDLLGADRVHADLHEYYPGLQDQDPAWVRLRQPYYRWMLTHQVPRVASVTTVSQRIADRYEEEFGFAAGVVENARPWMMMEATSVGETIRLVHAGTSLPNRNIENMMRATAAATNNVTLDLYLTGTGTPYYESLCKLADDLGERITIHDPVDQEQLISTLNRFDAGLHVLPPTVTNNALALPNKFFDFVQACLAVVIGPTEEMARRVDAFDIGAVSDSFELESLTETLNSLTRAQVEAWKQNSQKAAEVLDVSKMLEVWQEGVDEIIRKH